MHKCAARKVLHDSLQAFSYYNSFNTWGWLDSLPKEKLNQIEIFTGDIRDPNGVRTAMKSLVGVREPSLISL